jgi:nucleoside-diphosphate-sugar epimerase
MKVLVTGAGGFLGYGIASRLAEQGHQVHGFSRQSYPKLAMLGVTQHLGDLVDAEAVQRAAVSCDIVYHVAAKSGAWGSRRSYHDANVKGTQNILNACRMHEVQTLVYTSTPSVVSRGCDLEGVDESLPLSTKFKAHYPATKCIAERLVSEANTASLKTVSLRPHLVWGPGDTNLLPRLVQRARANRLRAIGKDKLIDTTYIDDAVHAHLLAGVKLQSSDACTVAGKAYFISSGAPIGTWTMINRMIGVAGLGPIERTISPRFAYAVGASLELIYTALRISREPPMTRWVAEELSTAHWFDISAAKRDLGYTPSVTLDEGMTRLSTWWRRQAENDND